MAGLWLNGDLLQSVQAQHPAAQATLDMDATLAETHKRAALYCYKWPRLALYNQCQLAYTLVDDAVACVR